MGLGLGLGLGLAPRAHLAVALAVAPLDARVRAVLSKHPMEVLGVRVVVGCVPPALRLG